MQIIYLTTPGTLMEPPPRSVELARTANDALARIQADHGAHFLAVGTLPLNDPAASVAEFDRAMAKLGMLGITLFSNARGLTLSDQRFWTLRAGRRQGCRILHPSYLPGGCGGDDGVQADATGGLCGRYDAGRSEPGVPRRRRTLPPHPVGPRSPGWPGSVPVHNDAVNFDVRALAFAIDSAGADHLAAGSDYPHEIGSLEKMLSSIDQAEITSEEKASILGGNAARLLGL